MRNVGLMTQNLNSKVWPVQIEAKQMAHISPKKNGNEQLYKLHSHL